MKNGETKESMTRTTNLVRREIDPLSTEIDPLNIDWKTRISS